jgi:LmbE family N-acetylglucosaminyl deacetylase
MVVAPHPDDEAFGCGGALLLAAKGGTKVHVLFITDGDASHPGHPLLDPSAIAAMRRSEARSSGAALGVEAGRLVFLGAPDGRLTELAADPGGSLSGRIAEQLIATRPDAVFLPSRRDGSSEHEAAFAIVQGALVRAGISPRVFEFPVWSLWDSSLLFPSAFTARSVWRVGLDGLRESKARAIGCYVSQLQPLAPDLCSAVPEGFAPMFLGSNEFFFEH